MKYLLGMCICCFFIFLSCEKSTEDKINKLENRMSESGLDIRELKRSSVATCDDISVTFSIIEQDVNCCNYQFSLEVDESYEGNDIQTRVFLNGIFYNNYLVESTTTFYLTLCPDPIELVEIYIGDELCFSRGMTCTCVGCDAVDITSSLISQTDTCCTYILNFIPTCDLPNDGLLLDYGINGVPNQNLKITAPVSISVDVCNDEKKDVVVSAGRGICFQEILECKSCCADLEYEINGKHLGDGCCEFTFEITNPDACYGSVNFGWNPEIGLDGIVDYELKDNFVRVVKCDPDQYVYFVVLNEDGSICYTSSNYQYCQD